MQVVAEIRYDRGNQIGLGQGMNSKVFLAHDPQLGGELAVKEIEKSKFGNDISKYFAEAQAMFTMAHPNIVPIRYACQTANHLALVMPYFVNGSLADRISNGPVVTTELIRVSQGVLHGLARIHQMGFIHFDIKPSNVLFDDTNAPLVADFGQSRRTLPNGTVQVPALYEHGIPPEAWQSGVGTHLSDVYQAGLLFYRAVNGDALYRDQRSSLTMTTLEQLTVAGKFPDRKIFLPHVPKRLRTIIRTALKTDPSERYQSATELASAIARIPPCLDWCVTPKTNGECTWQVDRAGKASLEVELLLHRGHWKIQVWTVDGPSRRARNRTECWRSNLSLEDATSHLNAVFDRVT